MHLNPLNAELNPICHLLALLGAHHILHVSRVRVYLPYRYTFMLTIDVLFLICHYKCTCSQYVQHCYWSG